MYKVYIIQNDLTKRRYIGHTNDFERRIMEHNEGKNFSTATKGSWRLIYSEDYLTKEAAYYRERKLKSYKGGNALKKIIGKSSLDGSVVERVLGKD